MRVLLLVILVPALAFRPIWIGPKFRESSLLLLENSTAIERNCGQAQNSTHFPWAAAILINGQTRLGGSIISPYHILTAAHGFIEFRGTSSVPCKLNRYRNVSELVSRMVVYGGKCIRGYNPNFENDPHCPTADVQHNTIRSVLLDGAFAERDCSDGHDWAIVELEKPIEFSPSVQPICLPWPDTRPSDHLTVVGWGRGYIFKESGPLMRVTPMLLNQKCSRPWSDKLPFLADDFLCATSRNTSDYFAPRTCHGDSGSGMEQRDEKGRATLIGITTFGTKGCPANMLARFTRVDKYLRAICQHTGLCYTATR